MKDFADTPRGWYQDKACDILASLSLMIEAHERMQLRGGPLHWVHYHEIEYHFKRAVYDTLRLLQILTHDTDIANDANLKALLNNGYSAFVEIIDGNVNGFDLEQ